jgi:hypothetical protein
LNVSQSIETESTFENNSKNTNAEISEKLHFKPLDGDDKEIFNESLKRHAEKICVKSESDQFSSKILHKDIK